MSNTAESQLATTRYTLVSASAAFLLWGVWAYSLNHVDGADIGSGMASALTQGLASFIITLFMVRAVTWIYTKLPKNPWTIFVPAIMTVCLTGSCLFTAHLIVGTARIVPTIAFPLCVAFAFCVYTTYKLRHNRRQEL